MVATREGFEAWAQWQGEISNEVRHLKDAQQEMTQRNSEEHARLLAHITRLCDALERRCKAIEDDAKELEIARRLQRTEDQRLAKEQREKDLLDQDKLIKRLEPLEKTYNYCVGAVILGGILGGSVLLFLLPRVTTLIRVLEEIHKLLPKGAIP